MNEYIIQGDIELETTFTSGQTFNWNRIGGELFEEGPSRFYTFRDGEPIVVEPVEKGVRARTSLEREKVEKTLGLEEELDSIFETFPEDRHLEKAREEFPGLRILQDEFFPTLIGYLLSPQNRIERIKKLHDQIAEKWGETVVFEGEQLQRFPTPEQLSSASEEELRELGTGYRAEYIVETTDRVLKGFRPGEVSGMSYEDAREKMKQFHGVGDKVADCVLLFSLGFHEAAPFDTWARKVLREHYPELNGSNYSETSENFRERFGTYAGYAQEYLFHAARNEVIDVK